MSYRLYEEAKEKFCDALAEIVEGKQRFSADDLRLAKEAISGLYKATILMEMENGDYSYADGMSYARRTVAAAVILVTIPTVIHVMKLKRIWQMKSKSLCSTPRTKPKGQCSGRRQRC